MQKQSEHVRMTVLQTLNQVVEMILPILLKPQSSLTFAQKIDPEVLAAFAFYLEKILDINEEAIPSSPHFSTIIQLMSQSLIQVSESQMT